MYRTHKLAFGVVLSLLLVTSVPAAQAGSNANSRVFPPNARPHGQTYAEWSALWWQYYLELPAAENPIADPSGTQCHVGYVEQVGLLFGSLNTVHCTIPAGTMLFTPASLVECSTLEAPPFYGGNEAELRACARSFRFTDLHAALDGVAIRNMEYYLVESPVFEFTTPEDNIFGIPSGATGQAVSYGAFLMLKPLPVGEHTLTIGGTTSIFDFTGEITYHITVVPRGQF